MATEVALKVDFAASFGPHQFGRFDPTARCSSSTLTKAFVEDGVVRTVTLEAIAGGVRVTAADALEAQVATWLAADPADFSPVHPVVRRLHANKQGLRLVRVPWLYDVACSAVLQQRVKTVEAIAQWGRIAKTLGVEGPDGLKAFPGPAQLAATPSWQLEAVGVDPKRARTLRRLATELTLHPLRPHHTLAYVQARLDRVPGVGPWTIGMVLGFGGGDPDAVPVGDLHLPRVVCHALTGEPRGTDERMLELLEPMRGHRFRVIRLLTGA
jgi:3-methyladenine DNA glycosylase/8-oxoguanine DNA glycosylase